MKVQRHDEKQQASHGSGEGLTDVISIPRLHFHVDGFNFNE